MKHTEKKANPVSKQMYFIGVVVVVVICAAAALLTQNNPVYQNCSCAQLYGTDATVPMDENNPDSGPVWRAITIIESCDKTISSVLSDELTKKIDFNGVHKTVRLYKPHFYEGHLTDFNSAEEISGCKACHCEVSE